MKQSNFLNVVKNIRGDKSICYHSLYGVGNLQYLYDFKYIQTLESFSSPRDISELDQEQIIENLIDVGFIVKDDITPHIERMDHEKIVQNWLDKSINGKLINYLNLSISEACNFGCPHCSRSCTLQSNEKHAKKIMSWETAMSAIDFYFNLFESGHTNNGQPDIHFGSDEPLLNKEVLKKSIDYIKGRYPDAILSINTNLSLLDEITAKVLINAKVDIITSLDGLKNANDKIRITKKSKGTFEVILQKTELLRSLGYPLTGYITTILDRNFNDIGDEFIEWLNDSGFTSMAYDVDLVSTMSHTPNECVKKLMSLHSKAKEVGIKTGGVWRNPFDTLVNGADDNMPSYCKATKGRGISVDPIGRIFACSGSRVPLGNILSRPDEMFGVSSTYFKMLKSRLDRSNTFCANCPLEVVCSGQCFMTNDFSDVSLQKENEHQNKRVNDLCYIYKKCTKHLILEKIDEEENESIHDFSV